MVWRMEEQRFWRQHDKQELMHQLNEQGLLIPWGFIVLI